MALTQVDLANMVTGVLPVANGGTGSSSALVPSGTAMLFGQTAAPTGWTKLVTNNNAALRVVSGSASTGGTVDFTTAFTSQSVSGTVGTSGSTTATGTVGATTLSSSQIPAHTHTYSGTTAGENQNHAHGSSDGTFIAQTQAVGQVGGGSSYAAINSWSSTTNIENAVHNHNYSGTTDNGTGGGGSHDHTFTGTAHTHTGGTFTGTAINLAVKYVDVIMATKD